MTQHAGKVSFHYEDLARFFVQKEDGGQAGEDGEGDEVGAHFEAHDDETGVHLEVEQKERHEEDVDHVPCVDRLELQELPAGGEANAEGNPFDLRLNDAQRQQLDEALYDLFHPG